MRRTIIDNELLHSSVYRKCLRLHFSAHFTMSFTSCNGHDVPQCAVTKQDIDRHIDFKFHISPEQDQ